MYVNLVIGLYLTAFTLIEIVMILGATKHYEMQSYAGFYLYLFFGIAVLTAGFYGAKYVLNYIKD